MPANVRHSPVSCLLIVAAVIVGFFCLLVLLLMVAIAIPSFLEAQIRSKVSRIQADFRTVATALEAYRIDHGVYPMPAPSNTGWTTLPPALTTPTVYLASPPRSPFATGADVFGYARIADDPEPWTNLLAEEAGRPAFILLSPGPARERGPFRLDWSMAYDPTNGITSSGYIHRFGGSMTMQEKIRPGSFLHGHESDAKPAAFTYDPTNGAITHCEGWSVKQ